MMNITRTILQPGRAGQNFRVLLINPRFPESFWSFRWALEQVLPGDTRALNPPLGLATLAALCPPGWQVQIIDENIEPVPVDPQVDIIGVCGMAVQYKRQCELLECYRKHGYYTVAGGSYASLCPERYTGLADTVIAGEAEYIWPRFCSEFRQGKPGSLYRETGMVDLSDSPAPRFDLLKLERYTAVSLQFSRGCPYRCDFCDIIVMFGRKPRTKSPEQIGKELDQLRSLGVHNVFFVDDNLIGDKRKAKELLQYLVDYQHLHGYAIRFGTQASLNLAEDAELLQLFRAAGFSWVFIGIESTDVASLKEINKTQNTRLDILAAVQRIYDHGIDVFAGFIVGFDNDTLAAFDQQYRFIMASGIQVAMIGLLTALPRTPLYQRLQAEQRLIAGAENADNTKPGTNFLPKRMNYDAMVQGYKALYRRLWSDRNIARRILNKTRYLRRPVYQGKYPLGQRLTIITRFLAHGIFPGGPARLWWFLRTMPVLNPRCWPQVISDWISGLAMRDHIKRYFGADPERDWLRVQATVALLRRSCAGYLRRGYLEISVKPEETVTQLVITLHGAVDRKFFTQAAHRLEKLLRETAVTISLRIEACSGKQLHHLDRLLRKLSCYRERVSLCLHDSIRPLLKTDLSVFLLVTDDDPSALPSTTG